MGQILNMLNSQQVLFTTHNTKGASRYYENILKVF